MTLVKVYATSDSYTNQAQPASNYGAVARLLIRGPGTSHRQDGYLGFTAPVPLGATVSSAMLYLYRAAAWTGSKTVGVRRVTSAWKENQLTHNVQPTNVATNAASLAANAGAVDSELAVDVTLIMRDVAAGGAYFGLRVDLTQDAQAELRSSEAGRPEVRPRLEVVYTVQPSTPDRLAAADGDAVSNPKPRVVWQAAEQASFQVVVDDSADCLTPITDTGKLAGSANALDLATTSLPAIPAAATRYWRVRVWSDADVVSEWSSIASFVYKPLAALAITSPLTSCAETTPPIVWSFAGAQLRYRVTLERVEPDGAATRLWMVDAADAATSRTPPAGLIVSGETYRATVDVWDTTVRAFDEHASASSTFVYTRSGAPAAPTGLVSTPYLPAGADVASPAVKLEWSRSATPDYWSVRVDGVELFDRVAGAALSAGGTLYRLHLWRLQPRVAHTVEVEAVVQSGGAGTPLQHSGPNPTVTVTTTPIGIWLVDESSAGLAAGDAVQLLGVDDATMPIGESATTYAPLGARAPVRITDVVRGYEGSVGGVIAGDAMRDMLFELKRRRVELRLVLQHLSIPVQLEDVSAEPLPNPGDAVYDASVAFFQSGEPWPVP